VSKHWLRRKVRRWAWRKIHKWAAGVKTRTRARAKKIFGPQVVSASAWERQFPDPRRPQLVMRQLDTEDWRAEFEAVFSNAWRAEFQVDIHHVDKPLREYAYDAAVLQYGEISRSLSLIEVTPLNAAASTLLEGQ
jgi:phage terminase large subunit GpA-like protein